MTEYDELNNLNFSQALQELKAGKRVKRAVWTAEDAWLTLVDDEHYDEACYIAEPNVIVVGGKSIRLLSWIGMRLGGYFVPWPPNQVDILADDWQVVDMV
jgi:hypothetical protein